MGSKIKNIRNPLFKYRDLFLLSLLLFASCKKSFLDVVPDNVATINDAFSSEEEAEKYLMTCYSYLPIAVDPTYNVGITASDLVWIEDNALHIRNTNVVQMPRGGQNTSNPIANYWAGTRDATACFKAIRDCNIFIENVSNTNEIHDLEIDKRHRWIAEVQFLKAFYNFMLFRAYGPIPIVDKDVPISASIGEMKVHRQPVDSVVNYIVNLLDDAAEDLPLRIRNEASELGRITKPIALSLKAKVLVYAASPLYNGNSDYSSFVNTQGALLFDPDYSVEKWERAAKACKEAIDACTKADIHLYYFPQQSPPLSDTTLTKMSIRNAMTEPWNSELIWGLTGSSVDPSFNTFFQRMGAAAFDRAFIQNGGITYGGAMLGPTLKCAKLFYTKNGVPIDEDKTLDFSDISELRVATHQERFDIKEGETTARLNFDREPRFYADLGFDRCMWYMKNSPSNSDENTYYLFERAGEFGQNSPIPITTYYMKKILNWKMDWETNTFQAYPYPMMRLAGLYLYYAEAQNEAYGPGPEVYKYINLVRERAGIQTVQYSWSHFTNDPDKYKSKPGMRAIIQRERSIELCFEGERYWDLLRWKRAATELSGNIKGWDRTGRTAQTFYRIKTFYSRHFMAPRDYLWPLAERDLLDNPNLVQNPFW